MGLSGSELKMNKEIIYLILLSALVVSPSHQHGRILNALSNAIATGVNIAASLRPGPGNSNFDTGYKYPPGNNIDPHHNFHYGHHSHKYDHHYHGSNNQFPGYPAYPGNNNGYPAYPGNNNGYPAYPGSNNGYPAYPGINNGFPAYPGFPAYNNNNFPKGSDHSEGGGKNEFTEKGGPESSSLPSINNEEPVNGNAANPQNSSKELNGGNTEKLGGFLPNINTGLPEENKGNNNVVSTTERTSPNNNGGLVIGNTNVGSLSNNGDLIEGKFQGFITPTSIPTVPIPTTEPVFDIDIRIDNS